MSGSPMVLREDIPLAFQKIRDTPHKKEHMDYPINRYLRKHDIRSDPTGSDVINFLKSKNILITGATGFLGKLMVEKLLRCCPDIEGIYVIVRKKKGKNIDDRIQEFLAHDIFVPLSRIFPCYKEKVIGLEGDFQFTGLGLSDESRNIIIEKVNIIYHIAATVRFHEKIKIATNINIRGTKDILHLAKQCKNLASFVHISTAYSNCNQKTIGEEFYPPAIPPEDLIKLTDMLNDEVLDRITPMLLGDLPNTYTFTKQIAEELVKTEGLGLPICVHRPSIVLSTFEEPIIAWCDNIFGPVGILLGAGLGVIHVMKGNPEKVADIVPADYVINSCIVSSYKTAVDGNLTSVPIYNYVSSPQGPLTWGNIRTLSKSYGERIGSMRSVYHPFIFYTKSAISFTILSFFLHRIPAFIIDSLIKLKGQKPQMNKVYDKFEVFATVLENFTTNQWDFKNDNTQNLWETMSKKDRDIFPFDMANFDWDEFFASFYMGVREFIVRDYLDTLNASRLKLQRLSYLHYFLTSLVGFAILWIMKIFVTALFNLIL